MNINKIFPRKTSIFIKKMNIIKILTIAKIAEIYQQLLMAVNTHATVWKYALTHFTYLYTYLRRADPARIYCKILVHF